MYKYHLYSDLYHEYLMNVINSWWKSKLYGIQRNQTEQSWQAQKNLMSEDSTKWTVWCCCFSSYCLLHWLLLLARSIWDCLSELTGMWHISIRVVNHLSNKESVLTLLLLECTTLMKSWVHNPTDNSLCELLFKLRIQGQLHHHPQEMCRNLEQNQCTTFMLQTGFQHFKLWRRKQNFFSLLTILLWLLLIYIWLLCLFC